MKKPPFQFGLKAAFVVTTGAVVMASFGVPSEAAKAFAPLAVIAALACIAVLAVAVFIAFTVSVSMMLYHSIRLCCALWSKPDPHASGISLPPSTAKR